MKVTRPEIDTRAVLDLQLAQSQENCQSSTTCVDLLQIHSGPERKVSWHQDLDHDALLRHVQVCPLDVSFQRAY